MPIFKTKNECFFKKWSSEMAYVLGFFSADGSMIKNKRGAHFIEFQITDKYLLEKIKELFNSNHKISVRKRLNNWRTAYRLQIGSKIIFSDLLKLGLTPGKSKRIILPKIPEKYFRHFVRGYFDGDGNVIICKYKRKTRGDKLTTILRSGFISGSKEFLENLREKLCSGGVVNKGTFYYSNGAWRLFFSINDSKTLYHYMYDNLERGKTFLARKKNIFEKYLGA